MFQKKKRVIKYRGKTEALHLHFNLKDFKLTKTAFYIVWNLTIYLTLVTTIVPSSIVLARCKNGRYSSGFVSSTQGSRHTVRLYTGETLIFDVHDSPALVLDRNPEPNTIHIGTRVVGTWSKRESWYPGKVTDVKQEKGVALYHVHFEDGDQCWHGVDDIRPVRYNKEGGVS